MRVEGWLFLGCAFFLGVADIFYWNLSHDPTGSTALALAVALAVLIGFYVLFTGRRLPERPEDNPQGEVEQETGELGLFPPRRRGASRGPARSSSPARPAVGGCSWRSARPWRPRAWPSAGGCS